MKKGNVALIILGLGLIAFLLAFILLKPTEPKDKYGELGKRKAEQESQAASPSASPDRSPSPSPTFKPFEILKEYK